MQSKLKVILILIGLVVSFASEGQDFTRHNWYFSGDDMGLAFGKGITTEVDLIPGKVPQNSIGEKLTVTDPTTGNLIFYSDGVNVYDATNQIMQFGNNLDADPNSIQGLSASPVPGPGNENFYYLFYKNSAGEVLFSLIDTNVSGNRNSLLPAGEVISSRQNVPTGITTRANGMMVIGSSDMTEFWLISQNSGTGEFEVHSIPANGGPFTLLSTFSPPTPIEALHLSYHNASNQIAVVPANNSNIRTLRFNEGLRRLEFGRTILNTFIPGETFGGSAGWSFSGQYLYFSRNNAAGGNIYRFDMLDVRDDAPLETVLATPVQESFSLQLAPDSSVYHIYRNTVGGDRLLGRVNEADTTVDLIEYESALFDETAVNSNYFSQFSPQANLMPMVTIELQDGDLCMNNPVQFFPIIEPSTAIPTAYFWDFQPFGLSSNQLSPIMTFEQDGLLSATLNVIINGELIQSNTIMREVIQNDLQIDLPDTTICPDEILELNAEPQQNGQGQQGGQGGATGGPFTYLWSTGDSTSVIEVSEAGDYWVVVTPANGCAVYATAQVEVYGDDSSSANIWYFGDGAGIDFNEEDGLDPPPRSITTRHGMNAPAGTSTISDANGDVQLYTDGSTVWNRENDIMPNGTDIGGDILSTQAAIIIPFEDDESLFYIFTTKQVYGDNTYELKYSVVDLKEDFGRGEVVMKDIVLFSRSTEKMAALEGGGGYWLLAHEYGNNTFRSYPITPEGIGNPVLSSAGAAHSFDDPLSGQAGMKFSQDGQRLAVTLIEGTEDYVELFDFNPATGEILDFEYRIDLNEGGSANDQVYDVHFSNGGTKLFATMNNRNTGAAGGRILEYRVDSLSTPASRLASRADITDGLNLGVNFGQVQTGPNGQIYVAVEIPGNPSGSAFVSSISADEDTIGTSTLTAEAIILTTGNSRLGLPNFVQNNSNPQMDPTSSSPDLVCIDELVVLTSTGTSDIDEFQWTITSQVDNSAVFSASGQDTSYAFPAGQSGRFNVAVNIFNRCGFDTTLVREIEVLEIPAPPTVPQALSICEGDTTPLDAILGQPDDPNLSFEWTNSQGVVVSTTRNFLVESPEIYTITVTNIAGCSSTAQIFAGPPFEIALPDASIICQDEELILDSNVTANIYNWSVINPDGSISPQTFPNERRVTVNSSVPGVFTYVVSIEDPITPGCFVNDSTQVTVNPLAQATVGAIVNPSCGDADGSFEFNVSTAGNYSYTITGNASGAVAQNTNFSGPGLAPTVTNLAADIYTVQITDNSSGCVNTLPPITIQNDSPTFTIDNVAVTAADCVNPTGDLTITLSAPVFPISYTLTNTDDGTTTTGGPVSAIPTTLNFTITGLVSGTYDLTVVGGGCIQNEAGIVVTAPQPVILTTEPFVEICGANAPLTATSNIVGTTFSWTGPNGFADTGSQVTVTESGAYTVTATGPDPTLSCPVSQDVVVDLTIQPIVTIPSPDLCGDQVTLEAEISNPEAGVTYNYSWTNSANTIISNARTVIVDASDTYSVIVRPADNLNCTESASIVINIPEDIQATLSSSPACDDGSPITLTVDVQAGNPTSFIWTRDGQVIPGNSTVLTVNDEGSYTVRIFNGVCFIERSIDIRRQSIPPSLLPEAGLFCPDRPAQEVILAGRGFVSYEWTLDGVPFPNADENLTPTGPGLYQVTMTTAAGCVRVGQINITESCDPRIIAPNAFVPSGNAPNNVFSVIPNDFVNNFQIFIYSRWGELIYQSTSLEFQWNGVFNGELVPLGTYPYVIRFTSRFEPERGTFEQSGAVTVVR